ncbi:MAG: hypothetical protein KY469_01475 [Actinobacteria bacterium]|nr:hypothetical protein [Actinomycetota bacterium]
MNLRRHARRFLVAALAAAVPVAGAVAGTVTAPTAPLTPTEVTAAERADTAPRAPDVAADAAAPGLDTSGLDELLDSAALQDGQVLVGAHKVSLYPDPEAYEEEFPGARWETDHGKCATLSDSFFEEFVEDPEHAHLVTSTTSPWPENPDCIYSGGFGLGPMNPLTEWDLAPGDPGYEDSGFGEDGDPTTGNGLWVRSVALSDGDDTFVLTVIDAEGYLYDYQSKCDDCGIKQLQQELGVELDVDPAGIIIHATHAHSAMDYLGGWGFVPDWYMAQTVDAIRESVRGAVEAARPAVVEIGEQEARAHNSERRDTYRSAEEQQLSWLRALDAETGKTIATVGTFAGHPTTRGSGASRAHADWPGVFATTVEQRFGGIGLHFMTGLGNMSTRGGTAMGHALAQRVPEIGAGTTLTDNDVRVAGATWVQPVTNAPLSALGLPGFFDREFVPGPVSIRTGKEPDSAPCTSASAFGVELPVSAARIGTQFALTTAPGEVFANLTNTIKEKSGALVTMPIGQTNDSLGYMPQDFEMSMVGQQGLGFVAGGVLIVNYEDSYAIDHCTGDHVLETSIQLLDDLR